MEACAASLAARGVRSGTIKCVRHGGSFNVPGKDTTRFFEAGSDAALVSDDETLRVTRTPPAWDRTYAESLFPEAKAILVEGRLVYGAVRVLVGGSAVEESGLKAPLQDFDVVVTEHPELAERAVSAGLAVFTPDEADSFVETYILGGTMEARQVTVTTGGVEVPINGFIKETIENVVVGLVKPLKKTDIDGEIVIRIGPAKR